MQLALQHRLEVLLHLASGYLYDDRYRHSRALRAVGNIGADDFYLAILHIVGALHPEPFHARCALAAPFALHIGAAHYLAFKRRPEGDWDRYFCYLDLDAARLDAFLYQPHGALHVILARYVVERHADEVVMFCQACRQGMRHRRVAYYGESEGQGAGACRHLDLV